ncbi:MAG: choice-of-anchor tandem repeat GloVer-containing protein, partial [Candidatus Cybelea sp.]
MRQTRPAASREVVLYRFRGHHQDGALPGDSLIADADGALYGTTVYGGTHDDGTVYKLTPKGSGYAESVLYSFKGGKDGANPGGRLIADLSGTLYGTTTLGGNLACANVLGKGCGTVFA